LLDRADVDDQGTGCPGGCEVGWFDTVEPATAFLEQATDGGPVGVLHVPHDREYPSRTDGACHSSRDYVL